MRGREVLRETREEVAKSGDVWRESRLVFFERSEGGEEKQFVLLGCACLFRVVRLPFLILSFCFSMMSFYFFVLGFLISAPLSLF